MRKCAYWSVTSLIVGCVVLIALPFIIRSEIYRRMKLTKKSTLFESWSSSRSGMIVEFYFFTVANIDDFMGGGKPLLHQVGPYTYEQSTSKYALNIFPQNGTVRYADKNILRFIPERSVGLESDVLVVLNLGYVAIANNAGKNRNIDFVADFIIRHYYHSQLFLNKTVYEMIWGYEDPALKFINKFIRIRTVIGLYAGKNNSVGPSLEVNDGVKNSNRVGQILSLNGLRELSVWKTPSANQINGSDGSLFPPFLDPTSFVQVFSADICRSLRFHPISEPEIVDINSIPTLRFLLSKQTFLSPEEYPDNQGFCLDYPKCPKSGIIDMRTCMEGAPIAISLPHFNGADRSYLDAVIGMHPRDDMDISLYIEPQTGVILQALQLIQANAIIYQNPNFPQLAHLKDVTYLPIGYSNTSIYVNEAVFQTLMSTLIIPQLSVKIAAWLMVSAGLVSLAVTLSMHFWTRQKTLVVDGGNESTPLLVECPSYSSSDCPPNNFCQSPPEARCSSHSLGSHISAQEQEMEDRLKEGV
uniref:Scavenger receptor class B member 1 n=1 Tax=Mesocestoides corti TaxID=53468 RepID=A0A5K3EMP5_MESCO